MAALTATNAIAALSDYIGQQITLKTGVTIRIDSVRRSGIDGGVVVISGEITKDGVIYIPDGGWPIVWVEAYGQTKNEALQWAQNMLAEIVR